MKTQEEYIFDGKFHKILNLEKSFIKNNQIITEVKSDLFHWYETNTVKNKLTIQRKWFENGIKHVLKFLRNKTNLHAY